MWKKIKKDLLFVLAGTVLGTIIAVFLIGIPFEKAAGGSFLATLIGCGPFWARGQWMK
jgi:hypothetical protein